MTYYEVLDVIRKAAIAHAKMPEYARKKSWYFGAPEYTVQAITNVPLGIWKRHLSKEVFNKYVTVVNDEFVIWNWTKWIVHIG